MPASDKNELELLTTVYTAGEAEVARIALGSDGIDCQIDGELQAGLAGVLPIKIYVQRDDLERAKALIDHSSDDGESH